MKARACARTRTGTNLQPMGYNTYNPYDRYRQRLFQRMSGIAVVVAVMALSMMVGYFFGKQRAIQEDMFLNTRLKDLAAERDQLQNTVTDLRSEARTATMRYEDLQKTYQAAVPDGPVGEIINLVTKQLKEGMDPQRLAFLIRSARPPRNCTDPDTQRFIVSTPLYNGSSSQADINDGSIIVKGSGASARNDKGDKEAWYDPTKAVTLQFTTKDGQVENKQGVMPISHSIVFGGREYRFTISEGARSFAKVTYDSCDYP